MQKKLLLFSALIVACMQANKQDPHADIKAFAKGALSVSAGLCVGSVIGNKIGHPDAATIVGGLLGALADHCASGGKRNPHYWWSKAGNAVPMAFAIEFIYLNRDIEKLGERRVITGCDKIYSDTNNLYTKMGKQRQVSLRSVDLIYDQLHYFVSKNMDDDWKSEFKAKEYSSDAIKEVLKHVSSISEPRQDDSRIACVGNYKIILRGLGAQSAYDLWRSLQPMPESIPLNLTANNTHYLSASVDADESVATYADVKEAVFVKLSQQGQDTSRFDQEYPEQTQESTEILAFNCDSIEWNTADPAFAKIEVGNKRFVIQGDLARAFTSWCDRSRDQTIAQMHDDK